MSHKNKNIRCNSCEEVIEVSQDQVPIYAPARVQKRGKDKFTLDISQITGESKSKPAASQYSEGSKSKPAASQYSEGSKLNIAKFFWVRSVQVCNMEICANLQTCRYEVKKKFYQICAILQKFKNLRKNKLVKIFNFILYWYIFI